MALAEGQITLEVVEDGAEGKTAYEAAAEAGYSGTEEQFNNDLADVPNKANVTYVDEETLKASKTATNYIVMDSDGALHVTDNADNVESDAENSIRIDSDSVDIIKNGQVVAEYSQGLTVRSDKGSLIAHLGYDYAKDEEGKVLNKYPYYVMGIPKSDVTRGAYSVAESVRPTASGYASHAEGGYAEASGGYSHAEGYATKASGSTSHAEGGYAEASGGYSHAEGYHTTASGSASHAEGDYTEASGSDSHAEGFYAEAIGAFSHAEGFCTKAVGEASHAQGFYTTAIGDNSFVAGSGNVADNDGKYAVIIGNGEDDDDSSNAYALDWEGNGHYMGDVYVGCKADSTGGKKVLTEAIPYVVASGTNNNWNFKRYSDGTYEATRVYETGNTTLRNATEGAYSYAEWSIINPPSFSKGISSVIGGCHNAGKWVDAYASNNTINFKVFAPASVTTSRAYTVDLKIEGTWS